MNALFSAPLTCSYTTYFFVRRITLAFSDEKALIRIFVERRSEYYISNVVFILFLLVLCSFSSVATPPGDFSTRISVSLTVLLAATAYKFVIAGMLPPVSYLTYLDMYGKRDALELLLLRICISF